MYVYKISHRPSGKTYVGKSARAPALRWADHINELKCNRHQTKKMQRLWNEECDITLWDFSVAWEGYLGSTDHKYKEAEILQMIPQELRLNDENTLVLTLETRDKAIQMLKDGVRYVDIKEKLNLSLGTISNIKREHASGISFSLRKGYYGGIKEEITQ